MGKLINDLEADSERDELTDKLKARLAKFSRRTLLRIFRTARVRSRVRGAYFWRNLKTYTWGLLAGPGA